jgi:predicted esterase
MHMRVALFAIASFCFGAFAAESPKDLPPNCWPVTRAEKLESALDGFFAETDSGKRAEIFKDLQVQEVGLTLDELNEIARAAPPEGEKRGNVWRVQAPWMKENPRGWFNLALPKDYSPRKACGLVIALHGSGSDGDNLPSFYSPQLNDMGYIIIYPTTTSVNNMWNPPAEVANVYHIMDWVARHYRVDFRRLVVTGGSMGGMGTWSYLLERPELWSVGASVAGHPAAMQGDILEKLRGIPFYILHGEKDTNGVSMAPVEHVRAAVEELKKRKLDCVYVEEPGAGHTPSMKYWQEMNAWIGKQAQKSFSPRPLFLPAAGQRPLWQKMADPMDMANDPVEALLKDGKYKEAKALLDTRIAKDAGDAKSYYLRAVAQVPGVLNNYPADLDPKAFDSKNGWGEPAESFALGDLDHALRCKNGKGDKADAFDSNCHLLNARILAKRFVSNLGNGFAYVSPYNNCVNEIRLAQKANPENTGVVTLAQALNQRLPKQPAAAKK